jgi:hypothetical protein
MKPAASRDRQREGLLATSYPQGRGKSDGHLLDKNGGGPGLLGISSLFGDGAEVWGYACSDTWNAERKEDVRKIPSLGTKAA